MKLPNELTQAIEQAEGRLAANASGELPLPARRRIWAALGPLRLRNDRAVFGEGLFRRTALATLATRKIIGIWERIMPPDDRGPHEMLELTAQYLRKEKRYKSVWDRQNKFSGGLDNLMLVLNEGEQHAAYVGHAAVATVFTAFADENFDPDDVDEDITDEDLDEWDAAWYAAHAFSHEHASEFRSVEGARRAFWEWYINGAVPAAWNTTGPPR